MKHSLVDRAKVQALRDLGFSQSQAAAKLKTKIGFIKYWWSRDSIERKQQANRYRKLTPPVIRKISAKLQSKSRKFTRQVSRELGISQSSVVNAARNAHLYPYHRPKKLILTRAIETQRLRFARANKGRDWSKVVFMDEKVAFLVPAPNSKNDVIWAPRGTTALPAPYDRHSAKINVCAAISCQGKSSIYMFEESLTGELCAQIIKSTIIPFGRRTAGDAWVLVMDGDPKHRSKVVAACLAESKATWLRIPAKSPDFNLIENAWSMFVNELQKIGPQSKTAFRRAIPNAWERVPIQHIKNTIDSMDTRLQSVIRKKGGLTKY